jgi:hypothetical protein
MIVSEPIQKQNCKLNQSKPKNAKTTFSLDEFEWFFHWIVEFDFVYGFHFRKPNQIKPNRIIKLISIIILQMYMNYHSKTEAHNSPENWSPITIAKLKLYLHSAFTFTFSRRWSILHEFPSPFSSIFHLLDWSSLLPTHDLSHTGFLYQSRSVLLISLSHSQF